MPRTQRAIYDERYTGTGYDQRSAVPVLTAERSALRRAVDRAISTTAGDRSPVTLFDFGFGTGRVTNEFLVSFPERYGSLGRDLRVIAYDVSAVGLRKAEEELKWRHAFEAPDEIKWDDEASAGYVAGSLVRDVRGIRLSVVFVHGNEAESPAAIGRLVRAATRGPALITTSWYSCLGHIPGRQRRAQFFRMLDRVTDPRGELLIAPSVSGDLVEAQAEWAERLRRGDIGDHPIEVPGDVMYETELHGLNFWHVFGTDLDELIRRGLGPHQRAWIEALRMPGPEFGSAVDEQVNYRQTQLFNLARQRRRWRHSDYRRVHTAVAVRSGSPRAR
ncbi:hypothetical protein [Actinoplanes sp. NPDC049599]|uniref:hypothetical protein n=1 Tax=Actinoplanes sp. NPDC049599 TaxID=3363903 RepID=UPI0037B975FD